MRHGGETLRSAIDFQLFKGAEIALVCFSTPLS